jgi:hypothetical protein
MTDAYDAVKSLGMFSGARQHQNFSNLKNLLPVAQMQPASQPHAFEKGRLSHCLHISCLRRSRSLPASSWNARTPAACWCWLTPVAVRWPSVDLI